MNHVGKEAFVTALSDSNLQLEVMKREPPFIEAAISHTIKVETYEQSLVSQATLVADQDEGRTECRPRNVYAVMDKQELNDNVALQRCV